MFGSLLLSVERVHPFAAANVIDDYPIESRSRTYVEDSASPLNLSTASASLSPVGGGGPPIDYFSGRGEIAVHQKLPVRADRLIQFVGTWQTRAWLLMKDTRPPQYGSTPWHR